LFGCETETDFDSAEENGVSETSAGESEVEFASGPEEYKSEWDNSSEDESTVDTLFLRPRTTLKTSPQSQPCVKSPVRAPRAVKHLKGG
jgi:hypothetical protein